MEWAQEIEAKKRTTDLNIQQKLYSVRHLSQASSGIDSVVMRENGPIDVQWRNYRKILAVSLNETPLHPFQSVCYFFLSPTCRLTWLRKCLNALWILYVQSESNQIASNETVFLRAREPAPKIQFALSALALQTTPVCVIQRICLNKKKQNTKQLNWKEKWNRREWREKKNHQIHRHRLHAELKH